MGGGGGLLFGGGGNGGGGGGVILGVKNLGGCALLLEASNRVQCSQISNEQASRQERHNGLTVCME